MIRNRLRRPSERAIAGATAAAIAILVGLVQFRDGIVHLLDTVSYWSGAQAVADGRPFTSRLAPSFSNFDAVDFVQRDGRIPFVDFPLGYPLVAGSIGRFIGVRNAMQLVTIVSLAAMAWAAVAGAPKSSKRSHTVLLGAVGVLIVLLPTTRCVTQGALSEPFFCAVAVWYVVSLARFRQGGSFAPVAILGASLGLLRFIGGPLVLMAAWEHHRRHRNPLRAGLLALGMIAPMASNALWASMSGGGHNAGWRGLHGDDISFLVRSVGGWFDSRQGDLRRTYFTLDGASWWSWVVAFVWLSAIAVAVIGMMRRNGRLPATAELALVASGIVTAGLVLGMLGFDGLVTPDNRLMLPSGVLTLLAIAWIVVDRFESIPARARFMVPALLLLWTIVAVAPQKVGERFSDNSGPRRYSLVAEQTGASVIVANDADALHWDTGLSAVYPPQSIMPLTGEPVDERSIYAALPCALWRHDGVVVLSSEAFLVVNRELLDEQVGVGNLSFERVGSTEIYRPTDDACR